VENGRDARVARPATRARGSANGGCGRRRHRRPADEVVLSLRPHRPRSAGGLRPDAPRGVDPFEDRDFEDSWKPPEPELWGPWQLLAAVIAVLVALAVLLGGLAAVSWLFFP